MSLDSWLLQSEKSATVATVATVSAPKAASVASVASVAVITDVNLEPRIRAMGERWQYSSEEVAHALQKASEAPIAWRDFVADDERWYASRH